MSSKLDDDILGMLGRPAFVLVGAGQLGEMAIDLWPKSVPLPKLFLDSSKTGSCRGIEIARLQDHHPDPSVTYLLSAFKLPSLAVKAIFEQIGQHIVLTVYDFFEHHCPTRFSNGWRCLDAGEETLARINAARACFADDASVRVFDAAVAWRYRRELIPGFVCELEELKYDLDRLSKSNAYDAVFDCGAYDLSFAKNLVRSEIKVGSYIAFEPDDINLARCLDSARSLDPLFASTMILERSAVLDRVGRSEFLNLGLLSSRLIPDADVRLEEARKTVFTTTLDEYVSQKFGAERLGSALIKLHIEGAELRALKGAAKFIKSVMPDVFVNLSHDENSLLDIPIYLSKKFGYKLILTGHSLFGEGLTLFATRDVDRFDDVGEFTAAT